MQILLALVIVHIMNGKELALMLGSFAALHPVAAGLCGFALMAVLAMGVRARIRRTAKREAWEMIAEDRLEQRARNQEPGTTYSEMVARQIYAD